MKATCMVVANGQDITGMLLSTTDAGRPRLISLRLRDQRGYESDTLEIDLDDSDGQVIKPPQGALLQVYLGWASVEQGVPNQLEYKGNYIFDEFSHSGPADTVTITAKAADMLQSLKKQKTRSWDKTTLGSIVQTISGEHALSPGIASTFQSVTIAHIDQTNESDMHFLTRLGKQYDAVVKPAAGKLLFVKKGASVSASGAALPLVKIPRNTANNHSYVEKGRTQYTGVRAYWQDSGKSRRTGAAVGNAKNEKALSGTFASQAEARSAAQAEYDRLQRDGSTFDVTLTTGRPELVAEIRVLPQGYRSYIDVEWVASEVTHELNGSGGLSTQIKCEIPQ